MAGVTKVLLQMHYEQLVPSLHAEVLNPHIDFSTTPFVVQQELSEWKRPQMPEGEGAGPLPRRAGISSFGAGGSNAHVILEEYVERLQESHHARPDERQASDPSHPALIVLSARTEEQLNERVRQLLSWMQECNVGEICDAPDRGEPCPACIPNVSGAGHRHWQRSLLDNLAYTLQVGREAMEQRLALLVVSLQELEVQLCRYTQGAYEGGDWYRGQVRRRDPMSVFAADEDGQKAIAAWIRKGKYEKLLSLWVNGASIDWNLLYTVGAGSAQEGTVPTTRTLPCRISLPTYPFAREHYWISTPTVKTVPCACPLPTEGLTAEVTAPPIGIVSPRSSGTSLLSIAQPEAGTSPGQAQAGKDKPQPLSVPTAQGTALTKRVALRPLADHPMPSLRDIGTSTRHSPLSLPADPSEGDQPQPPVMVSLSGQSQSGSNDEAKTGTRTPVVQEATLAAQVLESELTKSLANTLYMNERDVDVEKPFVEMGLDSVIGVEWIQSINKQYASNLGTARIYDYPTIRQLTGLLKKELLKQGGAIQQTPVQAMSTLSLDNVLQQVQQGTLDTKEADKLLQQIIYLA